eukprot:TRINITY_DN38003_c0_g1_i1.p1 TRINITY_DN38003_c0_g1~~TRINITY_DN38003_c0_g1_i1.p1  ORF type:complete len:787 (-),score=110.60 TRINITY_DN38003_c0_g1_i1:363-2543(-)
MASDRFKTHGLLHVQGTLRSSTAGALEKYVDAHLKKKTGEHIDKRWFGNVYGFEDRGKRWDMKLALDSEVTAGLKELLDCCQPLLQAIGQRPWKLVELASMCTFPGDPGQPVHADTSHLDEHNIVTVFVALHDVQADRGPTRMFPGTHTDKEIHLGLKTADEGSSVLCSMTCGDCVVMDSRLLHCGTQNASSQHRYIFYTSWMPSDGSSRSSTNTLLACYQDKLLVEAWQSWVAQPPSFFLPDSDEQDAAEAPAFRDRKRISTAAPASGGGAAKRRRIIPRLGLGRTFKSQAARCDHLLRWLHGRNVDLQASGVEVRSSAHHGLGLFALRRLHPGELMFRIPTSLCLHAGRVEVTDFGKKITSTCKDGDVSAEELLWLYMMWGLEEPQACPWYGYLQSLPKDDPLSMLTSPGASRWLRGTPLEGAARDEMVQQRQRHQLLLQKLTSADQSFASGRYDITRWLWARSCYMSRAFSRSSFPSADASSDVFCPILDILNHKRRAQVEWRFEVQCVGMVLPLTAPGGYEPGDEIYNVYGMSLGNDELLRKYGFAVLKNPFDSIDSVRVPVPPSSVDTCLASLQAAGFTAGSPSAKDGHVLIQLPAPLKRGAQETPGELLRAVSLSLLGCDYDEDSAGCSEKVAACRAVAKVLRSMLQSLAPLSLFQVTATSRKCKLPSRYSAEQGPAVYAWSYRRILMDALSCAQNEADMAELAAQMDAGRCDAGSEDAA